MEGRRRRAQRDIQTQPDEAPEASLTPAETTETPAAQGERRRRRMVQSAGAIAQDPLKTGEPLPQTNAERQTKAMNIPGGKAENKQNAPHAPALDAKEQVGERIRRAADASAKAGRAALKGVGGVILLALMTAGEGLKKLCAGANKLGRAAKDASLKRAAQKNAPLQEEYELEMIRPQDYRGRGQQYAQKETTGAAVRAAGLWQMICEAGRRAAQRLAGMGGDRKLLLNRLLSALLLCVALYSACQIGAIIVRSVRTHRLNESLARQRAAIMAEQETAAQEASEEVFFSAVQILEEAENAPQAEDEPETAEQTQQTAPAPTSAPDVVKSTKYRAVGGEALPEMADLYAKNRDLVAWIQIPDVLDLPVVYRDNSYYLTRDFNKQKNAAGTIFLDENHPFKEKTQNLLLHGHNMKDGTMFGHLTRYLSDDTYIRNHPFIYFNTLWNKEQYVIVAVLNVSLNPGDPRFFNYFTHNTFASDREFETYVRQLQLRSCYAIPIDVKHSDALLTLSTCLDDDRLVIVARRLRENETRSELRALIRMTTRQ